MTRPLPADVAATIQRVQEAGRYLDQLTLNVRDQATADLVRAHANAVWDAALALDTTARHQYTLELLRRVLVEHADIRKRLGLVEAVASGDA